MRVGSGSSRACVLIGRPGDTSRGSCGIAGIRSEATGGADGTGGLFKEDETVTTA